MNWQLVSFEVTLDPQQPTLHPPLIQEAIALSDGTSSAFRILNRIRAEGDKRFLDYYFSPAAIIVCSRLLAFANGTSCEEPSGSGFDLVA